jgi:hypothetical protein
MPQKRSLVQRQLDDSSSDDGCCMILSTSQILLIASKEKGPHGGSVKGHRVVYHDREGGHERMYQDYLADNPTYGPELFGRRFVYFNFRLSCFM